MKDTPRTRNGICVPKNVMVTGFDGSPEAEVASPSLTTAQIPSAQIDRISAGMLLERIAPPAPLPLHLSENHPHPAGKYKIMLSFLSIGLAEINERLVLAIFGFPPLL